MTIIGFLKFVEIQTKFASMIPLVLGTLYSIYRYSSFNFEKFIIMAISLVAFDMSTTAINNYYDGKRMNRTQEYDAKDKSGLEKESIKESTKVNIILVLLTIATVFGIILTIKTNSVVLIIGVISFLAGVFYTFGPIPLSRMPVGEIFSGVFMGFVILFLSIYIHIYDKNIFSLVYENNMLNISINIVEIFYIFIISIPVMNGIANIMLANNICDIEEDIINKRFTLPYYIGRKNALKLFKVLYYIGYIDIIILVVLKIAPIATLVVLFTIIPVNKNIRIFSEKTVKRETFILSVKNFVIINLAQILVLGAILISNH